MSTEDLYSAVHEGEKARASLAYYLYVFGDHLASRESYKSLSGIDAVHYYLVQKHNWLPSVVKAMTSDDLRFCLSEEMHGWSVPKEAR
ncbi:hypothetical protein MHM88_22915 [Epibacterium sp. MM17-32]|uniref:hypothetical protein n=1 Tax=Epibacterium sp. MM17-32 TaxID=2917734 RepID=UPI001EF49B57|nr:hypothetical protein [Epibacterium sp. MM17-32]MCG7630662.1 hypothetical protein [Epibacterium sp. MM17-32]